MMQSVSAVKRSDRRGQLAAKPVARVGTPIPARIVWALSAVVLSCAAIVAWQIHEPSREAVVLSPQSQGFAQSVNRTAPQQLPGLVSSSPFLTVAPLASAASATPAPVLPNQAQVAESNQVRAESSAITAGASSVPVSTWPPVTQASNVVPPRSDMRYKVNSPPQR